MMGESPTRPGIFQASPLVVVTPDISPLAFSARQLIVPRGGFKATCQAHSSSSSVAPGNIFFHCAAGFFVEAPLVQFVLPDGSRRDCFQTIQARRARSVSRSSCGNPQAFAKRQAPSPTNITWAVCSITSLATLEGVFTF